MERDVLISKLMIAGRTVTRSECVAFLAAVDACELEIVPKRQGPASAGRAPPPKPSFSHGRGTVVDKPKRRAEIVTKAQVAEARKTKEQSTAK